MKTLTKLLTSALIASTLFTAGCSSKYGAIDKWLNKQAELQYRILTNQLIHNGQSPVKEEFVDDFYNRLHWKDGTVTPEIFTTNSVVDWNNDEMIDKPQGYGEIKKEFGKYERIFLCIPMRFDYTGELTNEAINNGKTKFEKAGGSLSVLVNTPNGNRMRSFRINSPQIKAIPFRTYFRDGPKEKLSPGEYSIEKVSYRPIGEDEIILKRNWNFTIKDSIF